MFTTSNMSYLLMRVNIDVAFDTFLPHICPGVSRHPLPLAFGALVFSKTSLLSLIRCQSLTFGTCLEYRTKTDDGIKSFQLPVSSVSLNFLILQTNACLLSLHELKLNPLSRKCLFHIFQETFSSFSYSNRSIKMFA